MPSSITDNDSEIPDELIKKFGITPTGVRFLKEIMSANVPVSEDCLTLNVWTKPQVGERKRAVLVWIHGGSFVTGTIIEQLDVLECC